MGDQGIDDAENTTTGKHDDPDEDEAEPEKPKHRITLGQDVLGKEIDRSAEEGAVQPSGPTHDEY